MTHDEARILARLITERDSRPSHFWTNKSYDRAELIEAVTTWHDPSPRARDNRKRSKAAKRIDAARRARESEWAMLIADVRQLTGTDTAENIAARLGYTPASLATKLQKGGHPELAGQFYRVVNDQTRRKAAA